MVKVRANKGNAIKRQIARDAARWFAEHGMPIHRNIRVNINFTDKLDKDTYGETLWHGYSAYHATSFTITLNDQAHLTVLDLIETVMHEMVHVHQMATRRYRHKLTRDGSDYRLLWKGTDATDDPYADQPWEVEAFAKEPALVTGYLNFKHAQGQV